jgi:GT2 family glycosyltransferase
MICYMTRFLSKEKTNMQDALVVQKHSIATDSEPSFVPTLIREIELSQPLPTLSAFDEQRKQTYQRIRCLVRLHTQPIGLVDFTFDADEISPGEYVSCIWQTLREQINAHLREDGLPEVATLDAAGLSALQVPKCVEEREAFLQRAPFASVVLSTRDRPDLLARCLPTLLAQQYPRYEVIVVDNAPSTSATADLIQREYADEPKIRYLREDRPGLPLAHNRGIVEARGEIIAFTDDDVVVDAYWLAGLVRGFEAAENVACVTGLIVPLELETPAQFLFEAYGGFTKGFSRRIFDLHKHRWENPSFPYVTGACSAGAGASMAFTASFLRSEGGFDPALGPGRLTRGGEDIAAFFRVIIRGYSLVYEPLSLLYHQHRQNIPDLEKQLYDYGVAFTAYLTMVITAHPWLVFDCSIKLVRSLLFLWRNGLPKPENSTISLPQELKRLQRKGMLHGPLAYVRSRRASGRRRKGLPLSQGRTDATKIRVVASSDQSQVSPVERVRE